MSAYNRIKKHFTRIKMHHVNVKMSKHYSVNIRSISLDIIKNKCTRFRYYFYKFKSIAVFTEPLKNQSEIIGSFCLKKIDCSIIRLRQMAIEKKFQKQGYGSSILKFTEKFAIRNNYKKIIIIARLSAMNFYKKNFFKTSGNIFTDVTVSSINMYKKI